MSVPARRHRQTELRPQEGVEAGPCPILFACYNLKSVPTGIYLSGGCAVNAGCDPVSGCLFF